MLVSRLFQRRSRVARHFAQLDAQGNCVSVWALNHPPGDGHWVQVNEFNALWLGQPLPNDARVTSPTLP